MKIMAVLVAAMMIMSSFTLTAFAAAADYTIKIENALYGETYDAYKIFDAYIGTTAVYEAKVPRADILEDANRQIDYYVLNASTGQYDKLNSMEERKAAVDAEKTIYEKVLKPVAYTIKKENPVGTVNPWWGVVNGYKTNYSDQIKLTESAADSNVVVVEIVDEKFSAKTFAQELKKALDTNPDTYASTRAARNALNTTSTKPNGTNNAALTLNVGEDGTNNHLKGPGYYFVDTTTGALCALDTTTTEATVKEKNTTPTQTKRMYYTNDNDQTKWTTYDDVQIGETVSFRIDVTDGFGTDTAITVYDIMDAGLTFGGAVTVYQKVAEPKDEDKDTYYHLAGKTPVSAASDQSVAGEDYYTPVATGWTLKQSDFGTVKDHTGATLASSPTFAVELGTDLVKALGQGDEIAILYTATLDDDAIMVTSGPNVNKSWLNYASQYTPYSSVNVYTHEFDLVKYNGEGGTKTVLAGAVFDLYHSNPWDTENGGLLAGATKLNLWKSTDGKTYRVKQGDTLDGYTAATNITTLDAGAINIEGLDVGDYWLVETTAPLGYNLLTAPVKISITEDGKAAGTPTTLTGSKVSAAVGVASADRKTVNYTMSGAADEFATFVTESADKTYKDSGVGVANFPGHELPSTGGAGTTVLYIVGGMLVILAGAYLFFSRKRTA